MTFSHGHKCLPLFPVEMWSTGPLPLSLSGLVTTLTSRVQWKCSLWLGQERPYKFCLALLGPWLLEKSAPMYGVWLIQLSMMEHPQKDTSGNQPCKAPSSQQTVHHVREPASPPSLGKPSDDKHLTATHTRATPLTPSRFLTHRQGWSETVYGLTCYAVYDTATATRRVSSGQWQ